MLVDDLVKLLEKLTGKDVVLVDKHSYDDAGRQIHTNVQIQRLKPAFKAFYEGQSLRHE